MLKAFVIGAGFVCGSISVAQAQVSASLPDNAQTSSFYTPNTTLNLSAARPDFSVPTPTKRQSAFQFDNQAQQNFRTNLAESFTPRESNLLLEPSFQKGISNDAALDRYSAEIRLGNVSFERSENAPKGWYVFAAADGEALSMKTESIANVGDPMTLSLADQITVGDLQAGVSTFVADGTQLTFSYIETEASFSGQGGISASKRESFAGISLAKKF